MSVVNALKNQVIVSSQASAGEPFYPTDAMLLLVESVLNGGAKALRLAGEKHIQAVKARFPEVIIIGITKPTVIPDDYLNQVYITPTFIDVCRLVSAGADIVALDATARLRPDGSTCEQLIRKCRQTYPNLPLMADISSIDEAKTAEANGVSFIATTLSGYTEATYKTQANGPDFELLKNMVNLCDAPVIMEGRLWSPEDVRQAFELGAHAVVIGSAITRPHEIIRRFIAASPSDALKN